MKIVSKKEKFQFNWFKLYFQNGCQQSGQWWVKESVGFDCGGAGDSRINRSIGGGQPSEGAQRQSKFDGSGTGIAECDTSNWCRRGHSQRLWSTFGGITRFGSNQIDGSPSENAWNGNSSESIGVGTSFTSGTIAFGVVPSKELSQLSASLNCAAMKHDIFFSITNQKHKPKSYCNISGTKTETE